jgi:plasmid segregation protein ParM
MTVVVGLDVGYSNLKIAAGEPGGRPRMLMRPSGAAPAERLGQQVGVGAGAQAPVLVDVAGQTWAAGVAPSRLEGWQRPLHADYSASPTYEALAKAALVLVGAPRIDRLVTGLPVSQIHDLDRKDRIRQALLGTHQTRAGSVEVGEVQILPQPIGTFVDAVMAGDIELDLQERMVLSTVLVLDVGFYSVDWTLVAQKEVRRGASGTSLEAMSVLIDAAAERIATEYGGRPQPLAIEAALREGRNEILVFGKRVALQRFVDQAASDTCPGALDAMLQSLRRETADVDFVVLTGGGGKLYAATAASMFPEAQIQTIADPVGANARGFFRYGCR